MSNARSNAAPPTSDDDEIIWGAAAMASVINRTPSQTFHLLSIGALPAEKVGGMWVSTRGRLRRLALGGRAG